MSMDLKGKMRKYQEGVVFGPHFGCVASSSDLTELPMTKQGN